MCNFFSLKVLLNVTLDGIVPSLGIGEHALHEVAGAAAARRITRALHFGFQVVAAQTKPAKVVKRFRAHYARSSLDGLRRYVGQLPIL